jgi:hypothetical protein
MRDWLSSTRLAAGFNHVGLLDVITVRFGITAKIEGFILDLLTILL